jgi:hypothetical protein
MAVNKKRSLLLEQKSFIGERKSKIEAEDANQGCTPLNISANEEQDAPSSCVLGVRIREEEEPINGFEYLFQFLIKKGAITAPPRNALKNSVLLLLLLL